MNVTGNATLNAGSNSITLGNANNDFQSNISAKGSNVKLIRGGGQDSLISNTITPIVNSIATSVPKITVISQPIALTQPLVTNTPSEITVNGPIVSVVSQPTQTIGDKAMTLTEIKQTQNVTEDNKIVIPVTANSMMKLVGAGVRLPVGVEQLYFVVDDKNSN
jgi:hypothetical protein